MNKNTLFVLLMLGTSQLALADGRYQTVFDFSHDRYSSGSGYESDDTGVFLAHYFSPVDPKTYPYQEAVFLARPSGVFVGFSKGSGNRDSASSVRVGGVYASPQQPVVLEGGISKTDTKLTQIRADADTTSYTLIPGIYLQDTLLLALPMHKSDTRLSTAATYDSQSVGLLAKFISLLPSGRAVGVVGGISHGSRDNSLTGSETDRSIAVVGEYYFTRAFGLAAGLSAVDSSDDGDDQNNYSLTGTWFLSPKVYAGLRLTRYDRVNANNADNIGLNLGMRF